MVIFQKEGSILIKSKIKLDKTLPKLSFKKFLKIVDIGKVVFQWYDFVADTVCQTYIEALKQNVSNW